MAARFYSQADQDIYASGNKFIPQEQYRLGPYTPPAIMGQNTNTGIAGTQAAYPYKWPYPEGGGGGDNYFGPNAITKDFDVRQWARTGDPVHDFDPGEHGWVDNTVTGYQTPSGWKTAKNKNIFHGGWGKTDENRNIGDIEETEMDFSKLRNLSPVNFITTKLRNWKEKRDVRRAEEKIAAETGAADNITTTGGAESYPDYGQGAASQETQRSYEGPGGGYTGAGEAEDWGGGEKEGGLIRKAQGGRIGYRNGEFVDEDINVEGPGFDVNENLMASDPGAMDSLNEMSLNVFGKPLDMLTEEEYGMLVEMATDQASAGQDQGLASLV
jgi:hypothetical protein